MTECLQKPSHRQQRSKQHGTQGPDITKALPLRANPLVQTSQVLDMKLLR